MCCDRRLFASIGSEIASAGSGKPPVQVIFVTAQQIFLAMQAIFVTAQPIFLAMQAIFVTVQPIFLPVQAFGPPSQHAARTTWAGRRRSARDDHHLCPAPCALLPFTPR